jgi:hypothetical protein
VRKVQKYQAAQKTAGGVGLRLDSSHSVGWIVVEVSLYLMIICLLLNLEKLAKNNLFDIYIFGATKIIDRSVATGCSGRIR